jgi:uncharacterized lipoprotein YmbA
MHRRPSLAIAALLPLLASGCASPPSSFFTLSAANSPSAPPSDLAIAVGPVSVPATVDRPEIVVATGPNQVRIDEYNRWAAPLKSEIARTVAENLVLMLGTDRVTQAAQTASSGARYRALIEVQRLEAMPGESVAFEAVWVVRRTGDAKSLSGRTRVREPLRESGYGAVAAALSQAVGRLSQEIADAVRSLEAAPR